MSNTPLVETKVSDKKIMTLEVTITLEQYNKIKKEMSLVEVIKIFGDESDLLVTENPLTETRS